MFKMDNMFFTIVNKVCDIVVVSILWIICCIPVITAGAATTALYDTVYRNIRNNRGYCYKGFFKCLIDNFKNTVQASIIFFVLTVITICDVFILHNNVDKISQFAELQFVFLGFWILIMIWAVWTFAMTARFENSWKITLKNGGLMFFAHLPMSLAMAVIFAVSVFVVSIIPILIVVLPVGGMFINSLMIEKAFKRLIEAERRDDTEETD